jgi:hypothetical protein
MDQLLKKQKNREAARKYYSNNKEAQRASHKKWVGDNKEYVLKKQRERKRDRKLVAIRLMGDCCSRCGGVFHPSVYEFHHISPELKSRDPSKLFSLSWSRILDELEHCVMLCANCHRLTHHEDNYD